MAAFFTSYTVGESNGMTKEETEEDGEKARKEVFDSNKSTVQRPDRAPGFYFLADKEVYSYAGHKITITSSLESYAGMVWPAALAFCRYLETQQLNLQDKAVLEIGAGTGLVSVLATLLGAWVTATDVEDTLSSLGYNLSRNTRGRCRYTPQVAVLSWGYDTESTYPKSVYSYDYVLATDVVYHHDYLDELLATMKHFCQPGTTLIWANQMRFETDLTFTEKFKKAFHTELLFEVGEMKIFMATCREGETEENLVEETQGSLHEEQRGEEEEEELGQNLLINSMEKCPEGLHRVSTAENMADEAVRGLNSLNEHRTENNSKQAQERIDYKEQDAEKDECSQASVQNLEPEEERCKDTETENNDSTCGTLTNQDEDTGRAKDTEQVAVQQQSKPVWVPTVHTKWGNDIYYYVGEKIAIHETIDFYGAVMWPAALALCYCLDNNIWQKVNLMGKAVLELGAGTGLVTIVASLLGARVTATDLPDVLGNLRDNVKRNTNERCRYTPEVSVLSWGYNLQRTHPKSVHHYDYVLAADVVYHHDYLKELLATMKHFCQPGTTLIWANKVRYEADLTFTEKFKKAFHTDLLFEDGEMKIFMATCWEGETEENLVEETQGSLHEEQRREEEEGKMEGTGGEENKEYCVKYVKELGQNLLINGMDKCPEWLHCVSTAENMADEAVRNSLNEHRTENNSKQAQERIDYKEQDEEEDECIQASVQNLEPEEERCKDTETENNDSTCGTLTNQDEDTGAKATEHKLPWAPTFYTTFGKDIYYYVGEKITIHESIDSYGAVMWPAALALCYYLDNNRQKVNLMGKQVLELGAGTGLVTIVASLLGASATATDLPDVLGNLKYNVMRNTKRCRYTPQVAVLSWGYDLESTHPKSVHHYDYVLAADVVYHHDYLEELLATMKHFCQPGTTLIWANKVRYEADLTFTEKFKKAFPTELLVEDGDMKIFMATCREGETEENLVEETQGSLHEEQRREEEEEGEMEGTRGEENKEYCEKYVKELGQNLLINSMEKSPEWLQCVSTAENMSDEAVRNSLNEHRTENNSKQAQERIDYKEQDEEKDECSQASVQNLEPEKERCKDTETESNDSTCGTLTNQDEDTGRAKDTEQVAVQQQSKPVWVPTVHNKWGLDIYYYVGEKITIHESIDSYGAVMWPAALALCYCLDNNIWQKVNLMGKQVLELGAGTGLVTIVASLLGARVTATDLPDVLGNLRDNVKRNTNERCRYTPEVSVLSWGFNLQRTHPKSVHHYDYVLAADVVYHHDYLKELLATMKHFCQPGTTLIWANKVRYEADLTFTENFKKAFHTELLFEDGEMKIFMATCRPGLKNTSGIGFRSGSDFY